MRWWFLVHSVNARIESKAGSNWRRRGGSLRRRWSLLYRRNPPVLNKSGILGTEPFYRCGGLWEGVWNACRTLLQVSSTIPNVKIFLWAVTCEIKAAGRRRATAALPARGPRSPPFTETFRNEYSSKLIISPLNTSDVIYVVFKARLYLCA